MSPLKSTLILSPAPSRVIFAGNDSVPVMAPAAAALATACSISRCELMPTVFKNLRMLRFRASSFIGDLSFFEDGEILSQAKVMLKLTQGQRKWSKFHRK